VHALKRAPPASSHKLRKKEPVLPEGEETPIRARKDEVKVPEKKSDPSEELPDGSEVGPPTRLKRASLNNRPSSMRRGTKKGKGKP